MGDDFHGTWDQRVGPEAADILKQRSWIALIPVSFIVAVVLSAIALDASSYAVVTGALVLATISSYVYLIRRLNRRLARALSAHLGFEVDPRRLPQFWSVSRFDAWLRNKRSGSPPRERSFLRGFVRVQLPPK